MSFDNRRTDECYKELGDKIRQICSGKRVIYAPNVGNWGDGLIHTGTVQFFEKINIEVQIVEQSVLLRVAQNLQNINYRMSDCVIIAGGGGAWCNNWPGSRNFVQKVQMVASSVIVLPTTFELAPIEEDNNIITYFARDNINSLKACPQAKFCHDMAFFLNFDIKREPISGRIGYFFREDKEKHPDQQVPSEGYDISRIGGESKNVIPLFKILSEYESIQTDRLHVAIASSLLGIAVKLFPGNYTKIEDVYKSSILNRYPKTEFCNW